MQDIHVEVARSDLPHFTVAQVVLPSHLQLEESDKLVTSAEDAHVVDFLKFGCPIRYERTIRNSTNANHLSALNHSRDVQAYANTEVQEGAMLGPIHLPSFIPVDM